MAGLDLVRTAHPILEDLAERTRETVNLGVLSGDAVVYVDQISGTRAIVSVSWVGRSTPLHCTSNGKVLLANMPDDERDRLLARPLERPTASTIVDPATLRRAARRDPHPRLRADARGAGGRVERGRRARPRRRRQVVAAALRLGPGVPDAPGGPAADRAADDGGGRRRLAPARIRGTRTDGGRLDASDRGRGNRTCRSRGTRTAGPPARCSTRSARTPLVRLRRVAPDDVELLAKVEWYGPTGSVKDRIYAHMLAEAEERGDLQPGMTIVECTTGNAGIACAAVVGDQGLRVRDRDARGHERGAQEDDPRLRGRARADARRRDRHRPRDGEDARDGGGRARPLLRPGGVREPRQPCGAARVRRGDLGADRAASSTPSWRRRARAAGSAGVAQRAEGARSRRSAPTPSSRPSVR